jgi:hypothetical protein
MWKERISRVTTLLTYRIGGSYQHSPTCCVQCSLAHPTIAHLSVSLASSIQLSMPIRRLLALITCCYRYSHSLRLEHSSSGVSRSEGEGEEWVREFGRLLAVCNYPLSCTCGNPSRKRHMTKKESRFAVNNRLSIT